MPAWIDTTPTDFGIKPTPPPLFDAHAATGTEGDGLFDLHDL
ncbi:hypothetical protein ABT352_23165 [Streptosporangium sp. NPDC000563]